MSKPHNCDDECRYKSMYEGSQESLADMAARQASGVKRIDGLRSGVLSALKRHYPTQFTENERRLGKPLSSLSDEALVAYLTAFLSAPPPTSAARVALPPTEPKPQGTPVESSAREMVDTEVAEAASIAGVELPGSREGRIAALVAALKAANPGPSGEDDEWAFLSEYDPVSSDEPIDWSELFEDSPNPPRDLTTTSSGSSSAEDVTGGAMPRDGEHAQGRGDEGDLVEAANASDAGVEISTQLDELFDDGTGRDWEHLTNSLTQASTGPQADGDGSNELSRVSDATPDGQKDSGEDAAVSAHSPNHPGDGHNRADAEVESSPPHVTQQGGQSRAQLKLPGTVKPEIVATPPRPNTRKKAVRKEVRVSAETPRAVENNDVITRALSGPVPVFASDLTAALSSTEAYEQWEDHVRSLGTDSPVRFVTPKPRHRTRGLLVLPVSGGPKDGVWAQCLQDPQLRGTRMYELAVVLHRLGTSVRSVDVQPHTVVVRAATDRGVTGFVLAADSATPGEVAECVEPLLKERLSSVIILSMSAAADSVEKLASGVRDCAQEQQWKVSTPVLATRSWQWAENPAGTLVAVLG